MTAPRVVAVGVDVGSTRTKVVRIALDDVARPRVLAAPTPARAADLAGVVARLLHEVTEAGAVRCAVVGVASMAESGVPLDAEGRALTPILRWDGARAGEQARELATALGAPEVFAATGVRLAAKTPLATWAWLGREHPDVLARTVRWAGAADVVTRALTGRLVTDHTLAGRTGAFLLPPDGEPLPEGFDPALLGAVGLRPDHLPRVARPGEVAGRVTPTAALATGLPVGTPVVVAGHDHAVGAWAAGVRHPGDVADSLGTAEAVLTVLAPGWSGARPRVAEAGMSLVRTVAGASTALVAGVPGAGSLVRRWAAARGPGGLVPARRREPTGLLVLPYPDGRGSPVPDPAARLRLLDDAGRDVPAWPPPDDDAPRWDRALLEGLALHARWLLVEQSRIAGVEPRDLVVLGGAGGAGSDWVLAKVDASPVPVRVVRAPEPVASGAALLAAVRAGVAGPEAALPTPGEPRRSTYDAEFARFVAAALEPPHD